MHFPCSWKAMHFYFLSKIRDSNWIYFWMYHMKVHLSFQLSHSHGQKLIWLDFIRGLYIISERCPTRHVRLEMHFKGEKKFRMMIYKFLLCTLLFLVLASFFPCKKYQVMLHLNNFSSLHFRIDSEIFLCFYTIRTMWSRNPGGKRSKKIQPEGK